MPFVYCKNCTFWRRPDFDAQDNLVGFSFPNSAIASCMRRPVPIERRAANAGCGDGEPRASDVERIRSDCVEKAVRGHLVSALYDLADHTITPETIEGIVRETMSCARSFQEIEDSRQRWENQHSGHNPSGAEPAVDPDTAKDRR